MTTDTSGKQANYTGSTLEKFIRNRMNERGYKFVKKDKFKASTYLQQPIFTSQYPLGEGIYGTPICGDFLIYHPEKWKDCLIIECKWQQTTGSVDEKFPYLVHNIKEKYPHQTIIVLDGGGYRPQAETWLRNHAGDNLLHVFSMAEFQKWANQGKI